MAEAGKTGVNSNTPNNILFGAGTIHKNLKYTRGEGQTAGSWNFEESIVGATSGGSSLSIVPEVTPIEADGAWVATKGLKVKTGEVVTLEVNFTELTKDIIKSALFAQAGESEDSAYDLLTSKANIVEGDYWENIAFVGRKLDGTKIIVILENALCTSGLELGTANKEGVVATVTFECHATPDSGLDTLPYKIYYPKATA